MVWEIWVAVLSMPARCGSMAWQEMRNRTTPFGGGGLRWKFPAGLDRSTDKAGRRPSGRSAGTDRVPAHRRFGLAVVVAFRRNSGPADLGDAVPLGRSCRAASVGSLRSGWVCLAGIGGVPQLGQSPDDQALLERDDRRPRGAQPGRGVRQERVDIAPRSRTDRRMALSWGGSSGPGRAEVAPPQDRECSYGDCSRQHLRLQGEWLAGAEIG